MNHVLQHILQICFIELLVILSIDCHLLLLLPLLLLLYGLLLCLPLFLLLLLPLRWPWPLHLTLAQTIVLHNTQVPALARLSCLHSGCCQKALDLGDLILRRALLNHVLKHILQICFIELILILSLDAACLQPHLPLH